MIALGAALSLNEMFIDHVAVFHIEDLVDMLEKQKESRTDCLENSGKKFFDSEDEYKEFIDRHNKTTGSIKEPQEDAILNVYLGLDSGSTTTKFVFIDEDENVIDSFYASNRGDPLQVSKQAFINLRNRYEKKESN